LAVGADGRIWAWGWNHFGQLGDPGKHFDIYTAFQIPNLTNIVSVVATAHDSYALDTAGHVWAGGQNYSGPGGSATQIVGLPTIKSIAAGTDHGLALATDGTVWSWGSNQYGQVGDGGSAGWRSAVKVTSISGIVSVSATDKSSFAVRSDGTAWSWGVNWFGQLGDGTTAQRTTPIQVVGLSSVAGITSNGFATISWAQLPPSPATVRTIDAAVTPDSPLYTMKVGVGLSGVACPASITITVAASLTRSKPLCNTGDPSPTSTSLIVSVLSLNPETTYPVVGFVADAKGTSSSGAGTLMTPKSPVWIAVGDSYSSGHHQDQDAPCSPADFTSALYVYQNSNPHSWTGTCRDSSGAPSLLANDSSFAWGTRARNQLMMQLSVPPRWNMAILVLAHSGARTTNYSKPGPTDDATCNGCGEQDEMVSALQARSGSWNIVSISGGANDARFTDALSDFYTATAGQGLPWSMTDRAGCPNTDTIDGEVQATSSQVQQALASVTTAASAADPNVRRVAITYPYVVNADSATSVCGGDSTTSYPHIGTMHVIDDLDNTVLTLQGLGIMVVDLRSASAFSAYPMNNIQQTRYFGYPHPNMAGQDAIAGAVTGRLLAS
jgi:hypothetical protein